MKLDEKVLKLENRIIDFFTMFTWWTEVRFDKGNVYLAAITSTVSSLFFLLMLIIEIPETLVKKQWIWFSLFSLIATIQTILFLLKVVFQEILISNLFKNNPQGSPNPCRRLTSKSNERRISVVTFFAVYMFTFHAVPVDSSGLFMLFSFVCDVFERFLLACDSIPPQEKSRRKAIRESLSAKIVSNLS